MEGSIIVRHSPPGFYDHDDEVTNFEIFLDKECKFPMFSFWVFMANVYHNMRPAGICSQFNMIPSYTDYDYFRFDDSTYDEVSASLMEDIWDKAYDICHDDYGLNIKYWDPIKDEVVMESGCKGMKFDDLPIKKVDLANACFIMDDGSAKPYNITVLKKKRSKMKKG